MEFAIPSQISLINVHGEQLPSAPSGQVVLSSASAGWRGITLEEHRLRPDEQPAHFCQGHQLTVHTGPPIVFEYQAQGRWQQVRMAKGAFSLVTDGGPSHPRWNEPYEFIKLALDPAFANRVLDGATGGTPLEFIERRGVADKQTERLALLLRDELRGGAPGGPLFAESLATALTIHLYTRYGARGKPVPPLSKRGLSSQTLRRVTDYIENHLGDEISLETMARIAHVSTYYFARLFKQSVGLSPHQYVLNQRVKKALQLLLSRRDLPLADIAAAVGFYDQSHLTNHMKRFLGITPHALRAA